MRWKNSYFEIPSPLHLLQRWLNPEAHSVRVTLRDQPLTVSWTRRAERALARRNQPLLAEMQLYFSCVVQKRVLFHETSPRDELEWLAVNQRLHVAFRAVEANACDPLAFAANHPVRREFTTSGAVKMHPSHLQLDFNNGGWEGEFTV